MGIVKKLSTIIWPVLITVGCSRNAITGRSQLALYSESDIQAAAADSYKKFLTEHKVVEKSPANPSALMVDRVGRKLSQAITDYYAQQGISKELDGFKWEFNLVDSKEVNAWCMPGGKIVIYTGILPLTQDETALAIILGHTITHVLAKHGNERLGETKAQQVGGVAQSVAMVDQPAEAHNGVMSAYGAGPNVAGILPFTKKQEYDADRLGLRFAALAGYDPREAISCWQRIKAVSTSNRTPEILITHPLDDKRIEKLKGEVQAAQTYYRPDDR
ncbi:MAG: peptidase M48 [Bacteroidetes bacterium]|nr:MAG: peptidase M48 [Bacteroidota bacterium]